MMLIEKNFIFVVSLAWRLDSREVDYDYISNDKRSVNFWGYQKPERIQRHRAWPGFFSFLFGTQAWERKIFFVKLFLLVRLVYWSVLKDEESAESALVQSGGWGGMIFGIKKLVFGFLNSFEMKEFFGYLRFCKTMLRYVMFYTYP